MARLSSRSRPADQRPAGVEHHVGAGQRRLDLGRRRGSHVRRRPAARARPARPPHPAAGLQRATCRLVCPTCDPTHHQPVPGPGAVREQLGAAQRSLGPACPPATGRTTARSGTRTCARPARPAALRGPRCPGRSTRSRSPPPTGRPAPRTAGRDPLRSARADVGQAQAEHVVPADLAAALLGHEVAQVARRRSRTSCPARTRSRPPAPAHWLSRAQWMSPAVSRPASRKTQAPAGPRRSHVRPPPATPPAARRPRRIRVPRRVESLRLTSWTRPDRRCAAASSPRATRSFSATASASSSDRVLVSDETRPGPPVERRPVGVFVFHGHDLHVVHRLGPGRVVVQHPQQSTAVGPQRPDRRPHVLIVGAGWRLGGEDVVG